MTTTNEIKSNLFQTDDKGMDKQYVLQVLPDPEATGLFGVFYQNGKRGKLSGKGWKGAMTTYEKALALFKSTVASKKRDGYTEDDSGIAYQGTQIGESHSGFRPQLLLQPSGDLQKNIEVYLDKPGYIWEQKMDGQRRPIKKLPDGTVVGTQRDGLIVPLPIALAEAISKLPIAFCTLDGEELEDGRWAPFDLVETPDDPLGQRGFASRKKEMLALLALSPSPYFVAVRSADNPTDARLLHAQLTESRAEGLVAKLADAPYASGRNETQLKFPYRQRATLLVVDQPQNKRSVGVASVDASGATRFLGRVTIPANQPVPPNDSCVDVECLYLNPKGGGLHIPTYKGVRSDKKREDCLIGQLSEPSTEQWSSIVGNDAADDSEEEEIIAPSM